jgi:drug/metabolite transporter (DMT)-like permease
MQSPGVASAPRYTGAELSLFSILLLVDSLHFVFARALLPYFDPVVAATLVLLVATIQVGVFGVVTRQLHWAVLRGHLWFFVVVGALVGGSTALSYSAVAYVDTGTASMLGRMTTLFSIVIGMWWLHERLRPLQLAGAALALAGVAVIAFQPGDYLRLGTLLVITSTLMYALHAAVVKRYGQEMPFIDFFFARLLFTATALALAAIWRPLHGSASPTAWLLVILAGTVDVVISRSLYYLALRRLPMTIHAIILTLSPVATIVWAYFLFDTFPLPQQLLGGLAVLAGVLLATLYRP